MTPTPPRTFDLAMDTILVPRTPARQTQAVSPQPLRAPHPDTMKPLTQPDS